MKMTEETPITVEPLDERIVAEVKQRLADSARIVFEAFPQLLKERWSETSEHKTPEKGQYLSYGDDAGLYTLISGVFDKITDPKYYMEQRLKTQQPNEDPVAPVDDVPSVDVAEATDWHQISRNTQKGVWEFEEARVDSLDQADHTRYMTLLTGKQKYLKEGGFQYSINEWNGVTSLRRQKERVKR